MSQQISQHEKIRKITFGSILIAISLVLGMTGWGFIPLPLPIAGATLFHIPVILAGILIGPEIGFLAGLVFGFFAFMKFSSFFPWFALIPARPFIGPVAFYVFLGVKRLFSVEKQKNALSLTVPSALAGFFGSMTNSVGTLGLGFLFKVFGETLEVNQAAIVSSIPVVILEAVLAAVIVPVIVIPLYHYIHQKETNDTAD